MSAAALPPLLPTPPRSKMLPLLPTPCLIILPASFATEASKAPKPSRADAVDRWDAHKKLSGSATPTPRAPSRSINLSPNRAASCGSKELGSSAPSSSSTCSGGKPGRADTCERWDTNKANQSNRPPASSERWDINKIKNPSSRTPSLSSERLDSSTNKRPTASRGSSSPERWDINKKHRSQDNAATALGPASDGPQLTTVKPHPQFAGATFSTSPAPSMLPMPTFLLAR
ncbi:uncharacterized protein LOC102710345 [Oryza brachyantha]|uniref:Uncharacterized protein n=1 Tax=Oryza brachyantha TaxID=4533 RepID=J3N648_ORYBR|nr:uncharacterized protein LOC102710345 [Oryza brachyantha]